MWTGAKADIILMSTFEEQSRLWGPMQTKIWNYDHVCERDLEEPGNCPRVAALASKPGASRIKLVMKKEKGMLFKLTVSIFSSNGC